MAKTHAEQSADDYLADKRKRIAMDATLTPSRKRGGRVSADTHRSDALVGGYLAKKMSDDQVMAHQLPGKDIALPSGKTPTARTTRKPRSLSRR